MGNNSPILIDGIINFQITPSEYRHWRVEYDEDVATIYMDVTETAGLYEDYELKLNSYDLSVDIELSDIVQRMRFEHPDVKVVIIKSGKERVFCAGANIRMLASADHVHKVNFCKFTNETRNAIEAAECESDQQYICAIRGVCAGGGYELALACNHIMLVDDGSSAVALPEVPLLAVLPGTGGLTRLTDKRGVRRDLCDVFCAMEEGVKGQRAKNWRLVDEVVMNSKFDDFVEKKARELAERKTSNDEKNGISLKPLVKTFFNNGSIGYSTILVEIDRERSCATIRIDGPKTPPPNNMEELVDIGSDAYLLGLARELDDAILHLRFNEPEIGLLIFCSAGNAEVLLAHEKLLLQNQDHWLAREVCFLWKRVLKRIDLTSRSMIALVEHGSCFVGTVAELLFAVDRSYMMQGEFEGDNRSLARIALSDANFGLYPMSNGLSRLGTRFLGEESSVTIARGFLGKLIDANEAEELGLITFSYDDVDWEDEVRIFTEERVSFSPDAMTGMEANLRFAGPETMETKIFGRLTAWQNWIFQRPNAAGEKGALQRYGSGIRGDYEKSRV